MPIPNKYDVAGAILRVANGNGFRPSEVRIFLQNSGRFEAVGGALSAQMQQPLRELREKGYVAFDRNYEQRNNRPHIIQSPEQLQKFVRGQEITRHEPTASAAIESRLQEIAQMLGKLTRKVDQLSAQIQPSPENDHGESAVPEEEVSEMIDLVKENRDVAAFYQNLHFEDQDRFDRLLHFASTTAIQHGREFRVRIARGNNQPQNFKNVQSLVFADFSNGENARRHSKMYAIPLVFSQNRPITIIIRNTHRSRQATNDQVEKTTDRFRPYDLDHFLDSPAHYFSYEAGQNDLAQ